ncbi:cytosolic regulator of adenylyl cyclase [Heterostelium album PN500]|uniref:Cytosolic regulator of adenylyl cyclase n=1 Tax=Heterostelium pallidum (strain ATCC 26659 / Pp 5 / PN500) TaxID=670386 RepID=D3B1Y6_HETP5|nr:cytosolic regulator of adenylyl cyclase [Heterostelium album PN500]EFA85310.1 cytosolic regulator of adenylyl cyclase [Heterostelium album PN500]|eukprot:XP_020437419.1 cytosolic regulator of adenylyl cyclase [Heterostelium album PN500]
MDPESDIKKQILASLACLDDRALNFKVKLDHLNRLVDLKKSVTDISKLIPISQFLKTVRIFLATPPKTMRTSALRVIRYYATTPRFIQEIIQLKIHYFITRSLERDKHSEAERIQALKLIRTIMEIDCSVMPPCIVKSLVAIAENQEDNFCRVCLETLCEVAIRNPQTTAQSNGIRMLFDAVLDPFYQGTQESLLIAILYILNEEKTRVYVRPTSDLEIILSPLTNSLTLGVKIKGMSKEKEKEKERDDELNMKKWNGSIKAVVTLLKSWIGIISLSSDEQGLKSIVEALKMPQIELNDKILDALFEIFRFGQPKSGDPFRQQKASQNLIFGPDTLFDLPSRMKTSRHNLLNNYIAVLLIAFIDCGLIEGLAHLGNLATKDGSDQEKEQYRNLATKATVLLGELLYISNSLLPSSQCAKLQTLPALVNSAITFRLDPRLRSRSSTMVTNLHSYSHIKASNNSVDHSVLIGLTGADKWRRIRGQDRRLDKVDAIKLPHGQCTEDQVHQANALFPASKQQAIHIDVMESRESKVCACGMCHVRGAHLARMWTRLSQRQQDHRSNNRDAEVGVGDESNHSVVTTESTRQSTETALSGESVEDNGA